MESDSLVASMPEYPPQCGKIFLDRREKLPEILLMISDGFTKPLIHNGLYFMNWLAWVLHLERCFVAQRVLSSSSFCGVSFKG
jgi:hypothetical protein